MPRKEPLINDPRAPTKHSVKLPSGKRILSSSKLTRRPAPTAMT
jgi:hypothetical protein